MTDKIKDNSYRNVLKGISVFGGVQVFQILINLVRGKFVAMLLGPDGMGVSSIFTTSLNTLSRASSLGLNLAIVREVAEYKDKEDRLSELFAVLGKIITLTALGGCLLCVLFSGLLSRISFGSFDYSWQFILLGVAIYFSVAGAGKLSMLQGMHEVKRVAGGSLVGALAGLCAGIPFYYFFGDKGIVPAIVVLSLSTYLFYSINLKKVVRIQPQSIKLREHIPQIKKLILLGMVLLAGDLAGAACNYGVNIYLRYFGSLEIVGFYQAANSLTGQYAGMVFTAMSLDYFPRLTASIDDNVMMNKIVNRQTEMVAVVMAPIACIVIATAPVILQLLLSDSFLDVVPLMRWMGVGVMFRALHYPMGYIAFAKNNRSLFFWLEVVVGNMLYILGVILFYYFFGLIGLGYAFVADNIVTLIIYVVVNYKAYRYKIDKKTLLQGFMCIFLVSVCFVFSFWEDATTSAVLTGLVSLCSLVYCLSVVKKKLRE